MATEVIVEIINKRGLHARAAAKFVKTVNNGSAVIKVTKLASGSDEKSPTVGGSSILGLMMLGADPGSKLHITGEGDGADTVLAALKELIENRFDEDE